MTYYYNGWNYSKVEEILWKCKGSYTPKFYWVASRHGVSMNSDSEEGIKRMIDIKNYEMRRGLNNGMGLV
jgi:hypothetical protein